MDVSKFKVFHQAHRGFQILLKPGFVDQAAAGADGLWENPRSYAQNVIVMAGMPDVIFSMTPVNSIRGQIQLSTGEPAQGVSIYVALTGRCRMAGQYGRPPRI